MHREETGTMIRYELWKHNTSGEVWAVQLRGNRVVGSCGPLTPSERLGVLADYEYIPDDNDWFAARDKEFGLYEPQA
jgi:hypothetical protein